MGKLWLRLQCWWYDICLVHARQECLYCKLDRDATQRRIYEDDVERVKAEVRKLHAQSEIT